MIKDISNKYIEILYFLDEKNVERNFNWYIKLTIS